MNWVKVLRKFDWAWSGPFRARCCFGVRADKRLVGQPIRADWLPSGGKQKWAQQKNLRPKKKEAELLFFSASFPHLHLPLPVLPSCGGRIDC